MNDNANIKKVYHLEKQLREKMYELQRTAEAGNFMETELQETRTKLIDTSRELENERRTSNELRSRLNGSANVINKLEEEKKNNTIEQIQLKISSDIALNERVVLIEELKNSKFEIEECKAKIKSLEENLKKEKSAKTNLREMLLIIEDDTAHVISTLNDNIEKLRTEHRYLQETCNSIVDLNKRLQTFGLCAHAIHNRDEMIIKSLEYKLASLSINKTDTDCEIDSFSLETQDLHRKLNATLDDLKSKLDAGKNEGNVREIFEY